MMTEPGTSDNRNLRPAVVNADGSAAAQWQNQWANSGQTWAGLRMAILGGLGISMVFHAALLTVFALMTVNFGSGGRGGQLVAPTEVEVAILDESELQSLNEGPVDIAAPGVEEVKGIADLTPMPIIEVAGGSGLTDVGDIGGNMGGGLGGSGTGVGVGVGSGSGGAGAGGTSFFGVEVRGSRFAFVVDVSGSMDGEKIERLKRELIKAIDRLPDNGAFIVVAFESEAKPILARDRMLQASGKNKKDVISLISALAPGGGTNPSPAFDVVFKLKPRPDAIYFMTDGLFGDEVVDDVRRGLQTGKKMPVHCISFVDRSSEGLMRRIAELSGGSYTHVEGSAR